MATIKSYTDIEQSKELAEILPIESADMYYHYTTGVKSYHEDVPKYVQVFNHFVFFHYDIPCWSLAALLDVLKDDIKIEKTLFDQSDMFTYSIHGDGYEYRTYEHENLIDACYEMIIKLHERKLL